MKPFILREKMAKKEKRELDVAKRQTWAISPVTRMNKNAKIYDRKKKRYRTDDDGAASIFKEKRGACFSRMQWSC